MKKFHIKYLDFPKAKDHILDIENDKKMTNLKIMILKGEKEGNKLFVGNLENLHQLAILKLKTPDAGI